MKVIKHNKLYTRPTDRQTETARHTNTDIATSYATLIIPGHAIR